MKGEYFAWIVCMKFAVKINFKKLILILKVKIWKSALPPVSQADYTLLLRTYINW